jgi:murein DD-endopeptidase MepM/ murein hydrolase activator NlpD
VNTTPLRQAIVLATILLVAIKAPTFGLPSKWDVYVDEGYGFSIRYPSDWTYERGNESAPNLPIDTLLFSSRQGVLDLTVVVLENDLNLPLADAEQRIFTGHFGYFDRLLLQEHSIDGAPAAQAIYTQPEIEGTTVRYMTTAVQTGTWIYWLFTQVSTIPSTGVPTSSEQGLRADQYAQIVQSFSFLPGGPQLRVPRLSTIPKALPPKLSRVESTLSTFLWPSTGYLGYLYGRDGHNAIDIWTNTSGTGNVGSKGNPVYAVASGTISHIFGDSDGVPMVVGVQHSDLGLWTWYWHLADEYSNESYITPGLYIGQPVSTESLLGYQGNRRWEGMYDIIVHLHFGVSNVGLSYNQYGLDPSPYFGMDLSWPSPPPWMYYVERPPSTCCGCLPANCCSTARAQTSNLLTTNVSSEASAFSSAKLWESTAAVTCQTERSEGGAALAERDMESGTSGGAPFVGGEPDITAEAPPYEAIEVLTADAVPIDPLPDEALALRVAVEPERIPPTSANYSIVKSVFGSGGGKKNSTHYVMNGTQGQTTDLSRRVSASYVLVPGYWGRWAPSTFEYAVYLPLVVESH